MTRNVIIIGSGPAGLTSAIYTARANLSPLLFEGSQPGGQLMITSDVENFPGYPDGITGPEMMADLRKQAARFGTEFITKDVTKVDFSQHPFKVWSDKDEYQADSVIISTGSSAKWLNIPSEEALKGKGVSACATCDGFFFRDMEVMVVGGGDTAMEEAVFLTRFCKKVNIVHRRDELRASKIMQDRALENPKIEVLWNSVIEEIYDVDKGEVNGVLLKDTKTGETRRHDCQGVFLAIGHDPITKLFKGQLDLDETGYIITKPDSTYTSIDGIFACGDVQDHVYRQAITAAGSGCMAAIDCERWLEAREK